ncbi:hypothetical protein J3R83DRAFT_3128 [Lanmaoa asiatica]|nr:hypothetical protein J3R83DRAFT_3128 [Lanmaoa asiatica]
MMLVNDTFQVFLANQWKQLGFSVIQDRRWEDVIFNKLGVWQHPPSAFPLCLLEKKLPSSEEIAHQWFEILSERIPSFTQHELKRLSQLRIVPKTVSGDQEWLTPVQCYLKKSTKHDFYSKLFHFVDFGHSGNHFLRICGAKIVPSERDVVESLVNNPKKFYQAAGGQECFLQELRDLAAWRSRISNDTVNKMMLRPVLLSERGAKTTNLDKLENYPLWEPEEIVIVDDINTYQLFDGSVIAAPQDMSPELDDFYRLLGCRCLSTIVQEQWKESHEISDTQKCSKVQARILERVPLFLHHYTYSRPRASASWSSSANNIIVRLWEHLSVSKTLTLGSTETTKEQDVWAITKCKQGSIQIWISQSAKEDMYDYPFQGPRHFEAKREQETITTLYPAVDQVIIKHQQHINDSGLADIASPCCSTALESPSLPSTTVVVRQCMTEADPDPKVPCSQSTINHIGYLGGREVAPHSLTPSAELLNTLTNIFNVARNVFHAVACYIVPSATPWAAHRVMSRSDIQDKVNEAIEACNIGERNLPYHDKDADMIKFLKNGYCDISELSSSLRFLGKMENMDVYIGQGILDADTFMESMREPLAHFVRIITPISKIYKIPVGSLRIFHDDAGCIAFNCKGILYLNLRYFKAWRE